MVTLFAMTALCHGQQGIKKRAVDIPLWRLEEEQDDRRRDSTDW
jgi:hypothetical protein